ncbi:hypothetical protein MBLNU459_g8413t1 [Dothideomycetes sp. NU459]
MEKHGLSGKVVLFGTPAEEGGGGKIKLLRAGAYSDQQVDISLISHPGTTPDAALVKTAAYYSFKVEYHGNITNGGAKPNIIHAYAAGTFVVRSTDLARMTALKHRVYACFRSGAQATGATLVLTPNGSYADHVPNRALGATYRSHFNHLGGAIGEPDLELINAATMASTDQGNISYAVPSLSPGFWIRSLDGDGEDEERQRQGGGPHTPDFERAAGTSDAFSLALRVAKGLAATAVDVLTNKALLADVKREFDEMKRAASGGEQSCFVVDFAGQPPSRTRPS